MAKDDPPQGEQEGWKRLADADFEDVKALDDAAKQEEKPAATAAFSELSSSCMECHKAHRPS